MVTIPFSQIVCLYVYKQFKLILFDNTLFQFYIYGNSGLYYYKISQQMPTVNTYTVCVSVANPGRPT